MLVSFDGDELEAIRAPDGGVWVGIRRICDNLSLLCERQLRLLHDHAWADRQDWLVTYPDGETRVTETVTTETLRGWLCRLDDSVNRPRADPAKLLRYQRQAAQAIENHFAANRPVILDGRDSTVRQLVAQVEQVSRELMSLRQEIRRWDERAGRRVGTVKVSEMVKRMGISSRAFTIHYLYLFTERRPLAARSVRPPRLLLTDEIEVFFEEGPEALVNYRWRKGRINRDERDRLHRHH